MPVVAAYERFRALWGLIDWQGATGNPYSTAQTKPTMGTSAAAGTGVGVRRCVLHVDRQGQIAGEDDAEFHFDFLNITGGSPDDTWTSGDYTTLEGYLDTFWTAVKGYVSTGAKLAGYHWYRHGPGIVAPNPAERVVTRSVADTSSVNGMAPQCAATITFETAVRRSWGRTYLPALLPRVRRQHRERSRHPAHLGRRQRLPDGRDERAPELRAGHRAHPGGRPGRYSASPPMGPPDVPQAGPLARTVRPPC